MKKRKLIIIILVILILLIFLIKIINKKASPILISYAEAEARKISSIIINKAVAKHITNELKIDELFITTKNSNGEVRGVDLNPVIVNKVLTQTTNSVQMNIKYLEQGNIDMLELSDDILVEYDKEKLRKGIIFEIPSGVVFNNILLNNLGPKIPVKINLVGDILSGVSTKVTNYGLNNALIEVFINLEITEQVVLPFISNKIKVSTNIPIAIKIIEGIVPDTYLPNIKTS